MDNIKPTNIEPTEIKPTEIKPMKINQKENTPENPIGANESRIDRSPIMSFFVFSVILLATDILWLCFGWKTQFTIGIVVSAFCLLMTVIRVLNKDLITQEGIDIVNNQLQAKKAGATATKIEDYATFTNKLKYHYYQIKKPAVKIVAGALCGLSLVMLMVNLISGSGIANTTITGTWNYTNKSVSSNLYIASYDISSEASDYSYSHRTCKMEMDVEDDGTYKVYLITPTEDILAYSGTWIEEDGEYVFYAQGFGGSNIGKSFSIKGNDLKGSTSNETVWTKIDK